MAPFWFLAGVLFTLSTIILLLPWLRTVPRLGSLPALPWQAGAGAVLTTAVITGLWLGFGHPSAAVETHSRDGSTEVAAAVTDSGVNSWEGITNALAHGTGVVTNTTPSASRSNAQPMASAIASLQSRLAKGGGSAEDWELLAKSYEFLGRTADANKVRAHQLPSLPEVGDNVSLTDGSKASAAK